MWEMFRCYDNVQYCVMFINVQNYKIEYINPYGMEFIGISGNYKEKHCYELGHVYHEPCDHCKIQTSDIGEIIIHSFVKNNQKFFSIGTIFEEDGQKYCMKQWLPERLVDIRIEKMQDELDSIFHLTDYIKDLTTKKDAKKAILGLLEQIRVYYGGTRAYVWEFMENIAKKTYEVTENNKKSTTPVEFTMDNFLLWEKRIEEEKVIYIPNLSQWAYGKEKYPDIISYFEQSGKHSIIVCGIYYNGEMKGLLCIDNPEKNADKIEMVQTVSFYFAAYMSASVQKEKLIYLSFTDHMTGMFNRNAYQEKVEILKKEMHRSVGLVITNINHMKEINQRIGYEGGNQVIKKLTEKIQAYYGIKYCFRVNGDEFASVVLDKSYEEFKALNKKFQNMINEQQKDLVTVTSVWSDDTDKDMDELLIQAEQMNRAEKNLHLAENISEYAVNSKSGYIKKIVDKLFNNQILLYLQPQYDVNRKGIYAAEALARMQQNDGTVLAPFKFIGILEETGMISKLDFQIFEKVCLLLKEWEKKGYPKFSVATNFSRITANHANFIEQLLSICDKTGVDKSQLTVEITETSDKIANEKLENLINELAKNGLKVSMDDMGTKNSTLTMLELPNIAEAKFDRSMVMRIKHGNRPYMVLDKMTELCHNLGMKCVAEGVETEEQFHDVKEAGCDIIQGYLFGKPMPAEEFEHNIIINQKNADYLENLRKNEKVRTEVSEESENKTSVKINLAALNSAIDNTEICTFMYFPKTKSITVSKKACEKYQCNHFYDHMPQSFADTFVWKNDRQKFCEIYEKINHGSKTESVVFKNVSLNYKTKATLTVISKDEDGNPVEVLGLIEDVSEVLVSDSIGEILFRDMYRGFYIYMDDFSYIELRDNGIDSVERSIKQGLKNRINQFLLDIVADESRDKMRKFTNLDTLKERLETESKISCDYKSKVLNRWCEGKFLVVDRSEDNELLHVIFIVEVFDSNKQKEIQMEQKLMSEKNE